MFAQPEVRSRRIVVQRKTERRQTELRRSGWPTHYLNTSEPKLAQSRGSRSSGLLRPSAVVISAVFVPLGAGQKIVLPREDCVATARLAMPAIVDRHRRIGLHHRHRRLQRVGQG
jgi:hypothetical protein